MKTTTRLAVSNLKSDKSRTLLTGTAIFLTTIRPNSRQQHQYHTDLKHSFLIMHVIVCLRILIHVHPEHLLPDKHVFCSQL